MRGSVPSDYTVAELEKDVSSLSTDTLNQFLYREWHVYRRSGAIKVLCKELNRRREPLNPLTGKRIYQDAVVRMANDELLLVPKHRKNLYVRTRQGIEVTTASDLLDSIDDLMAVDEEE